MTDQEKELFAYLKIIGKKIGAGLLLALSAVAVLWMLNTLMVLSVK